ncbi:hypothetical protein, partial [Streptococcus suis]|uniref:hypothetical protein n=1 Tax=Streptococcus suis TaxID=1307 RepID=UPI0038BCC915
GLFVYTQKGSIISTVDLPTTEIIEPLKPSFFVCLCKLILFENQNYPLSRALMSEKLQWIFSACYLEMRK